MNQKEQMLKDIGILDFALVELTLYLDTHPYDRSAMEHFNHYSKVKVQLEKEFSQKYFPLRKDLAESYKNWRWGDSPSPWEANFPGEITNCSMETKAINTDRCLREGACS